MAEGPDDSVGDGDKAKSGDGKAAGSDAHQTQASDSHLPVVWSPKLDAEEPQHIHDMSETADFDAAAAPGSYDEEMRDETGVGAAAPGRSSRFVLLAASVAIAAGLGSFLGSLAASGVVRLAATAPAVPRTADTRDVVQALKAQLAELTTIKTSLDSATRSTNGQFAKLADRLDSVEHAAADSPNKLAQISDTLDRLAKPVTAAPETTGSIATTAPSPAASAPETKLPVIDGWIVQDVREGRALVASRYGGEFVVSVGGFLPGVGRVDAVKRQDGQWIVVTARGLITSGR